MDIYKQLASNIIDKNKDKESLICTCGIGPTGKIHIGKTFDIICASFVSTELRKQGRKVDTLCFVDDCITDLQGGMIDSSEYIQQLKKELDELGMSVSFVFSSDNYRNNVYNQYFKLAYSNENLIHRILREHHTGKYTRKLSAIFNVYCPICGRLVQDVDSIGDFRYSYSCECGSSGIEDIFNKKTFLRWKIETPVRWYHYNSCFEPAAFNHGGPNGSFVIAQEIYTGLFKHEPPQNIFYQYFCDEKGDKFSARKNVGYTITDILSCFYPSQLLEYLRTLNINRPIKFGMGKMFNHIYYGKHEKSLQENFFSDINLPYDTAKTIISMAGFYFYDSDVISGQLRIECTDGVQDFIKKIEALQSYNPIPLETDAPSTIRTVLGYLIERNGFENESKSIANIKYIIGFMPSYSFKLFCKDFYGFFYNTECGPPLKNIIDNCPDYLNEVLRKRLRYDYSYMIVSPEGMPQLDSIKEYVSKIGLRVENEDSIIYNEVIGTLPIVDSERKERMGCGVSTGEQGTILILSGYEVLARLECTINKTISSVVITSFNPHDSSMVLAWYFKAFVYDSLKEKIVQVINMPVDKDRYERHVVPVVENVKRISTTLSLGDEEYILTIAALLHDIAKFHLEGIENHSNENHAEVGARWVVDFLRSCNVCGYYIEKICRCIERHSSIPEDTASMDERIIAAADGMAHIDYPWILICKYIMKHSDLPYSIIYDKLFYDRLDKSLNKITIREFQYEYRDKIDKLKRLLK